MPPPTYDRREIYPHAPLQLVAAEIRYSYAPRLRQLETLDALQIELEDVVPIRRNVQQFSVEFNPAGVHPQAQDIYRLFDKEFRSSVAVTPDATTVETTSYVDFEGFHELLERVLRALAKQHAISSVDRIGLRFVDEVRVPTVITCAADWKGWIADHLTAAGDISDTELVGYQGMAEYSIGPNERLAFRYGAMNGSGVVGSDPLQRKDTPEPGPFFLLDVDSFWSANAPTEAIEFDVTVALETLSRLHLPTGSAFQASLTDRLRATFRGD